MSIQSEIIAKIQRYRDESTIWYARNNLVKSAMFDGRADGLEEAYKIFISQGGK